MGLEEKIFSCLNSQQAAAVRTIHGPVLVFAGAGTGKTRVITHRIAYMIYQGINPSNIAAMTFTNKAANEMRERLLNLVGSKNAKPVSIGTFHSYCARLLRNHISPLGWTPEFTIADDSDQLSIVKQAIAELGLKDEIIPSECLAIISKFKSQLKDSTCIRECAQDIPIFAKIADIFDKYNSLLFLQNMLDFDDLLVVAIKLLENFPSVLSLYRQKHTHILVDEYQDTNYAQFRLLELLAGENMNICAVGDDDQSIYGWRGAEVQNILQFPKHFKGTKIFKLEQNYRSTTTILSAANAVISKNINRHDKKLWSDQGVGENISFVCADNEEVEALFVAEKIESLKLTHPKLSYDDIAVLYRSNYQSRNIEEALRAKQIPYKIIGAHSFYERKEVRDAIAYLRLIINPRDDQSFSRIIASPPRGIGEKSVENMRTEKAKIGKSFCELIDDPQSLSFLPPKAYESALNLAQILNKYRDEFSKPGSLAEKTENFLKEIGYLDGLLTMYKDRNEALKRQENVFELINAIATFEKNSSEETYSLADFLEKFALLDDSDKVESSNNDKPSVTLMTVHSAKGLEFSIVFIIGLEQGIFPHERSLEENGEEEERRLFYVALTRAKLKLFLSMSNFRFKRGQLSIQKPSSFLSDIPEDLLQFEVFKNACIKTQFNEITTNYRKPPKYEVKISYDD